MKKLNNNGIEDKITSNDDFFYNLGKTNTYSKKTEYPKITKLQNSENSHIEDIKIENDNISKILDINDTAKFATISNIDNISYIGNDIIDNINPSIDIKIENDNISKIKSRRRNSYITSSFSEEKEKELKRNEVVEYLKNSISPIEKLKPTDINKSEEIYINYNELADRLTVDYLKDKYKKDYNELKHIEEYNNILNTYINIILEHERKDE